MIRMLVSIALLGSLISCKSDSHYQLVDQQYNFSIVMPEPPDITTGINDEGLASKQWVVEHKHLTDADYYSVSASCYKEVLDPDNELTSNDAMFSLNGIKVTESHRLTMVARETGRKIPALARTTRSGSDEVIGSIAAVDGHCLISVGTRINPGTAAENARFLGSFQFLR